MNKFSPLLIALALVGGCSSGGGTTSSGDGLGVQTTESNLLLTASLEPDSGGAGEGPSVDAFNSFCDGSEFVHPEQVPLLPIEDQENLSREPGIFTKTGTMTINVRDLVDSSGLTPVEFFPEGVTFDRYRVSYTSPNSHAPFLEDRVFRETFTLPNGTSSGSFQVILVDIDVIHEQFVQRSSGSVASYNVKVTASGQEFNGSPISVSAETFLEIGDFNRCGA